MPPRGASGTRTKTGSNWGDTPAAPHDLSGRFHGRPIIAWVGHVRPKQTLGRQG
jgi:hypothetical protein